MKPLDKHLPQEPERDVKQAGGGQQKRDRDSHSGHQGQSLTGGDDAAEQTRTPPSRTDKQRR